MTDKMEQLIEEVNKAATGAEIRLPLINVFKEIFENGKNAEYLNSHSWEFFAKQSDMAKLIPYDTWATKPKKDSTKLVVGGTIFMVTGDLDILAEEVEDIVSDG